MAGWNEGTGGKMCPTERALVAAVCAEPYDDTPRLVYADWLDEQDPVTLRCGACLYASYLERCATCGSLPGVNPEDRTLVDTSRKQRAELIRLQHALPGIPLTTTIVREMTEFEFMQEMEKLDRGEQTEWENATIDTKTGKGTASKVGPNPDRVAAVARVAEIVAHAREREWFLPSGLHTMAVTAGPSVAPRPFDAIDATTRQYNTYSHGWDERVRLVIDRGFVGAVYCKMETWSGQLAPSMMYAPGGDLPDTAEPVTAVYFTDQTEAEVREMDVGLRSMWPSVRFGWFDTYGRTNPAGASGLIERPAAPIARTRRKRAGRGE